MAVEYWETFCRCGARCAEHGAPCALVAGRHPHRCAECLIPDLGGYVKTLLDLARYRGSEREYSDGTR